MRAPGFLLALACLLPAAATAEPGVASLRSARILLDDRATPPDDDDPRWENVTLPDEWRRRRPEREGYGWYRLELAGPVGPRGLWALYLPSLGMNAAAFVNGEPVGSGGRMHEPVARNFNRPLYFPLSSSLLGRARNVIHIRLWCYATPHHGYLGPVSIGPDAELRGAFESRLLRQAHLPQLASAFTAVILLFLGGLWIGTRFDGVYGWFVLAAAFWTVSSLNSWVRDIPVATWTWERLVSAPFEGFAVALALWVHRFLGLSHARVDRALLAFGAAAFAAIALVPLPSWYQAVIWLHAGALAISVYAVVRILARIHTFSRWQAALYAGGGALCLAFGGHDLAVQLGRLPATSPLLVPFVAPVMLTSFGTTLAARFVRSLRTAESLSLELERRVEEKRAELEQTYSRMRSLERAQVLAAERERIMREMHDGLGGHLVSALSLAEAGDTSPAVLAGVLQNALDEMRVVIDSLDPHVEDLGQLLGQLRARLEPVLRRSGLHLRWDVGLGQALPAVGPEQALHVLRILQEAITNVVRHAAAREVRVSTRVTPAGGVVLSIRDDGRGGAAGAAAGRGIANMRERARKLGGALSLREGSPGTTLELELGLTPPRA